MATNFYKENGSYYVVGTNKKIANMQELQTLAKAGGKEVASPTQQKTNKATLTSPDGRYKTIVDIGSSLGNQLLGSGWTNSSSGKQVIDSQLALSFSKFNLPESKITTPTPKITTPIPVEDIKTIETDADQDMNNYLDNEVRNGNLTEDLAKFIKDYVGGINTDEVTTPEEYEILAADAELLAKKDLDPYYKQLKAQSIEDLKTQYADIRNESARYQQQEEKSYKETLASTKASLRARGLTFSGSSRGTLGSESALSQIAKPGEDGYVEGTLPQARRYNWEDRLAGWQETARDLGTSAERLLGSAGVSSADIGTNSLVNPYKSSITYNAGENIPLYLAKKDTTQEGYVPTGTLALERKEAIEKLKQEKLSKLTKK
jgi:hypothetical protein